MMNLREVVTFNLFQISILFNFAEFYLGQWTLAVFALPIVLMGRFFYMFSPDLFYVTFFAFHWLAIVSSIVGVKVLPAERSSQVLVHRLFANCLAFLFVQNRIFHFLFVAVAFNVIFFFLEKYFKKNNNFNLFVDFIGDNPQILHICFQWFLALSTAFLTNFAYQIFRVISFIG